jgi:hypothetical protein
MNSKFLARVALAASMTLAAAAPASAAVTLTLNPGGQLSVKLYNAGDQNGDNEVFLETNTSPNYLVKAVGDRNLDVDGNGFAIITGEPLGKSDNLDFDSITFSPVNPLLGFQNFQFMVQDDNTLNPSNPAAPTFLISWTANSGVGGAFVSLSGNKNYQLDATTGDFITSVKLSNLTGYAKLKGEDTPGVGGDFLHVKQISYNAIVAAVPEPSTWAMMLLGFFGAGALLRSNRRRQVAAVA